MKKNNLSAFFDFLKDIFRFDRYFLWACLASAVIGAFITGSQYFWRQREREDDRISEFKKDASNQYDSVYRALNQVDEDLLARKDICLSAIPEKDKLDQVFELKIKRYNNHRFLAFNEIASSRDFFRAPTYAAMKGLMGDLDEKDEEFHSCSPESLKILQQDAWSQKKIALTKLIQQDLHVVRDINTPEELEKYEDALSKSD